ncbi:MAG: hypothetical protein ACQETH_14080 [Candidatus Rifleibacteriota bacterium]
MNENAFWRRGFIYLIVAIILAYPGLQFCFKGFREIRAARKTEQWREVKAEVKSFEVKPIMERGERVGQYVAATYTYRVEAEEYVGNTVAVDPSFGGSVNKIVEVKSILEKSIKDKKKLSAFVDPQKLEHSILFKIKPVRGLIFVGVGLAFLFISLILFMVFVRAFNRFSKRQKFKILYSEQPWKWEPEWHSFILSPEPVWKKVFPLLLVSITFWAVSAIILVGAAFLPQLGIAEYAGLLTLVLIDFVFLIHCRRKIRGERWADKLYLVASSYPIMPGKSWKCRIVVEKPRDMQIINGCKIFFRLNKGAGVSGVLSTEEDSTDLLYLDDATSFCLAPDVEIEQDRAVFNLELILPEKAQNTAIGVEYENRWQLMFYFSNESKEVIETFELPVYSEERFDKSEENKSY